jgi:hypothetical protein
MRRLLPVLLVCFFVAGCELIGDVFQAGLIGGIVLVILVVLVLGWIFGKFRGR